MRRPRSSQPRSHYFISINVPLSKLPWKPARTSTKFPFPETSGTGTFAGTPYYIWQLASSSSNSCSSQMRYSRVQSKERWKSCEEGKLISRSCCGEEVNAVSSTNEKKWSGNCFSVKPEQKKIKRSGCERNGTEVEEA